MIEGSGEGVVTKRFAPFALIRLAFGAAGLVFAGIVVSQTGDNLGGWQDVEPLAFVIGVVLIGITTAMAARAWSAILSDPPDPAHRHAYYSALIGKYIPGGFFQAAGQVTLASRSGLGVARASSSYLLSMALAVAAGLLAGGGLVVAPGFNVLLRALALVGVAAAMWLLSGSTLATMVGWIARVVRKPFVRETLPPRRQIMSAVMWDVGGLLAMSTVFALIMTGLAPALPMLSAVAAFLVAWLIGFVAIPFPAGLGVREAVLISLLAPWQSAGLIITASLLHRLVTVVAEVLVFLSTRLRGSGQ